MITVPTNDEIVITTIDGLELRRIELFNQVWVQVWGGSGNSRMVAAYSTYHRCWIGSPPSEPVKQFAENYARLIS